jgi:hypothetical protein
LTLELFLFPQHEISLLTLEGFPLLLSLVGLPGSIGQVPLPWDVAVLQAGGPTAKLTGDRFALGT